MGEKFIEENGSFALVCIFGNRSYGVTQVYREVK